VDREAEIRVSFFRSRYTLILSFVLLLQAVLFYAVAQREEDVPTIAPLSVFPDSVGGFHLFRTLTIDQATQDLLKADDTLDRIYADPSNTRAVELFVAYFKTQRLGQSPHSPKNCLPGSGWEPISADRPAIQVPGWPTRIVVNRYVVEKGDARSISLYWYQSHNRVVASEYSAKFWLVADALRYHRSDTSLVRITVPLVREEDIERSTELAIQFARAVFPQLLTQMPL
jgi:EpsI family protein